MTATIGDRSPKSVERQIQWAKETLGVGPQQSFLEARSKLLSKLADAEFVPDESLWAAFQTLRAKEKAEPVAAPLSFLEAEHREMVGAVETLAQTILQMPNEQRLLRWNQLRADCDLHPDLIFRLEMLKPAWSLQINPPANESAEVLKLAECFRELLSLPNHKRIERRAEMLAELIATGNAPSVWSKACKRIVENWPELADFDREFARQVIRDDSVVTEWKRNVSDFTRPFKIKQRKMSLDEMANWSRWILVVVVVLGVISRLSFTPRTGTPNKTRVNSSRPGEIFIDPSTLPPRSEGQGKPGEFQPGEAIRRLIEGKSGSKNRKRSSSSSDLSRPRNDSIKSSDNSTSTEKTPDAVKAEPQQTGPSPTTNQESAAKP